MNGGGVPDARRVWQTGDPLHAVLYFAPETRTATRALGVPFRWMGYFGCRAAPLGAVSAAAATAVFYNLAPAMVEGAIPQVWEIASPAQLLEARIGAVDLALRRLLGDQLTGPTVRRAAELANAAANAADDAGRPLGAANRALPTPEEPHLALWHALTVLREFRGDGHIAVLLMREIAPCAAHVLVAASGRAPAANLQRNHEWNHSEWSQACAQLIERGWLSPTGQLTPAGMRTCTEVEAETDRLASGPFRSLGRERTRELLECLRPLADTVMNSGAVPVPNPAGLTWPPDD